MTNTLLEEKLREEVEFWRGFIDHWKRVNKTPPLPRMLDALTYAEHKLEQYLSLKNQLDQGQDTEGCEEIRH